MTFKRALWEIVSYVVTMGLAVLVVRLLGEDVWLQVIAATSILLGGLTTDWLLPSPRGGPTHARDEM